MSAQGNLDVSAELVAEAIQFRNKIKAAGIDDEWGGSDDDLFDFNVWVDEHGDCQVTIYPVVFNGRLGSTDTSRWYTVDPAAYKD